MHQVLLFQDILRQSLDYLGMTALYVSLTLTIANLVACPRSVHSEEPNKESSQTNAIAKSLLRSREVLEKTFVHNPM